MTLLHAPHREIRVFRFQRTRWCSAREWGIEGEGRRTHPAVCGRGRLRSFKLPRHWRSIRQGVSGGGSFFPSILLVDHSLTRSIDRGAIGEIVVEGPERPDLFTPVPNRK